LRLCCCCGTAGRGSTLINLPIYVYTEYVYVRTRTLSPKVYSHLIFIRWPRTTQHTIYKQIDEWWHDARVW
jgi:hypothetical protein